MRATKSTRTFDVSLPEVAFVAATRGIAGAGIGLLLAERMPRRIRRNVGWTLLTIGLLTTLPIVLTALRRREQSSPAD